MKHENGITQPAYLIEDWPGRYEAFSWLEYVVTVPNGTDRSCLEEGLWP